MGELIDLFANLEVGRKERKSRDVLRQVYEYLLAEFASAAGKQGGEFYTPQSVVRVLVAILAPGRYVGVEAVEEDGEPFGEKMERLVGRWRRSSRSRRGWRRRSGRTSAGWGLTG